MMVKTRVFGFLASVLVVALASCGGGGGGGTAPSPVQQPSAIAITPDSLADAWMQVSYSAQVISTCTGSCTWILAAGTLPDGLSLAAVANNSSSAAISGTPSKAGQFTFTLQVTNGASTATKSYTLVVVAPVAITTTGIASLTVGKVASVQLGASGGKPPYRWTLTGGEDSTGLTLTPDGVLSGIPYEAQAQASIAVQVQDSSSPARTAAQTYSFAIQPAPPDVYTSLLPNAHVNALYTVRLSSGDANAIFAAGTDVPAGMTIAPDGTIRWTPYATGTYSFSVRLSGAGVDFSRTLNITVVDSPSRNDSIATATPLSNGILNAAISPYADASGQANPDTDFYLLKALGGATVQVAVEDVAGSPLDPVIEIVDATGQRFRTCQDPADDDPAPPIVADTTPLAWDDECLNDDRDATSTGAALMFRVPGSLGSAQTFFVHVLDWRGDARPDMLYTISINGAQ